MGIFKSDVFESREKLCDFVNSNKYVQVMQIVCPNGKEFVLFYREIEIYDKE